MSDVIRLTKKEKEQLTAIRSYYFEYDPKMLELLGSSDREMLRLAICLAVSYLRTFDPRLIDDYFG